MKDLFKGMILFLVLTTLAQAKFVIIVHESNPLSSIHVDMLSDYFLKRNRSWPHGSHVRFFDRSDSSVIRKEFLRKIIHKTPREVDQYWIGQKLYTGNSAPTQIETDDMTLALVSRFPGAIGYVSEESLSGTKSVKKLEITGISE